MGRNGHNGWLAPHILPRFQIRSRRPILGPSTGKQYHFSEIKRRGNFLLKFCEARIGKQYHFSMIALQRGNSLRRLSNLPSTPTHRRALIPAVSAKLANKLKQRYEKLILVYSQLFWSNTQRLCELQPESRSWVKIDWVICN